MDSTRRDSKIFRPTPHEIRSACERIQQRWSDRERRKRAGRPKNEHWSPPLVTTDWLATEASSFVEDGSLG